MNIIGNIGLTELIVIFLLALLVLGPERLPEVSRKLGKLVRDLRAMYANLSRDLGPELASLPTAIQEVRETAEALKSLPRDAIRTLSQAAAPEAGTPSAPSSSMQGSTPATGATAPGEHQVPPMPAPDPAYDPSTAAQGSAEIGPALTPWTSPDAAEAEMEEEPVV